MEEDNWELENTILLQEDFGEEEQEELSQPDKVGYFFY